jgi:hypothetical protein
MPTVEESPTGATPEGSAEGPDDGGSAGTGSTSAAVEDPTGERGAETRASRRARREAQRGGPALPPLALVLRPATVAATVVLAVLLVVGVATDPVVLAVALGITTIVLAWGWPRLLGSSSRFGSSFAIGVNGVLTAALAGITSDQPYLRLVPVALAVGLGLMFGHQILRRDGRPRLTESVGITSFGLALVAVGSSWMPLSRSPLATDVAVAALVAIAVSSLADLGVVSEKARPWMLPVAMVLGGGAALVTASVSDGPGPALAALTGLLVSGVAHVLRRVLVVLPGIGSLPAQLAAAAAGVLVPGVVAYGLSLALVG